MYLYFKPENQGHLLWEFWFMIRRVGSISPGFPDILTEHHQNLPGAEL